MDIHKAAQIGFSTEAAKYEQGRPEYASELQGWLRSAMSIRPGSTVIDLGAGTGKFTRLLVGMGADVIAVEPVEAMRLRIAANCEGARVLAGTAERIPLEDGVADAVICAQAFHWFANPQALGEMHRVLARKGRLGLVWNVRDETVDWVAAITRIITPYEGDAPRFHTGRWKEPFERQALFTELQRTIFRHAHVGPFERVVIDRFLSVSFIAALDDHGKRSVEGSLRALQAQHPALQADPVAFPYLTEAWSCEKY